MAYQRSEPAKLSRRASDFASAFKAAYPAISRTISGQVGPTEQENLRVLLQSFPQLAEMQRTENLQTAADQLGLMKEDVRTLGGLAQEVDPEYFALRQAATGASQQLMTPGLTGGETSAIERALAQSGISRGTQFAPSTTETVGSAMTYGNAARDRFSQALTSATALLPQLKQNISPVRSVSPTKAPAMSLPTLGSTAQGTAQGVMGQVGEVQKTGLEAALGTPSLLERMANIGPELDY